MRLPVILRFTRALAGSQSFGRRARLMTTPDNANRAAAPAVDRPQRVGLCITELEVGGAERCLVELATRLDRRRFEPHVYALSPPPPQGQTMLVERLADAGVPVTFLDGRRAADVPRTVRRLAGALRADGIELLQTFLFHANVLGALAARRAGVRRLCWGIRVAEPGRRWRDWAARRLLGRVDRHVCVSREVAEFWARRMRLGAERTLVIANGVDLERQRAAPIDLTTIGLPVGARALVCVGRIDQQKNTAWLVELGPTILGKLPEHHLLFVGQGPLRQSLEARAAELGLAGRVRFVGWRPDVPGILAASDLLLLPSRWEGMPNVVLEAMAAGMTVVATSAEGVGELLGRAGPQMVAHGDGAAFAAAVVELAGDAEQRALWGRRNLERAATQFSLQAMVQRYEALYEGLFGQP
jgi:starch synthase (maltosyl-transferring)